MKLIITLILTLNISVLIGQTNPIVYDSAYLDINNINARFNAGGNHFWDMKGTGIYEAPKGSGLSSMFTQTLWISARDSNNTLRLAADRFSGSGKDFFPGPVANNYSQNFDLSWNHIWEIERTEIDQHILWTQNASVYPNYQIPQSILQWPAHGDTLNGESYHLAPFHDYNKDGKYNPQNGDYPLIKGDKALWLIINDDRLLHTETGGNKLKIEIGLLAYAYDCNGCINNTIYLEYSIKNKSNTKLLDTRIGIFSDFDIGYGYDDYIGADVNRGAYYGYNGDDNDGYDSINHYWKTPPALGVVVLKGIKEPNDGIDNLKFHTNGQLICGSSINGYGYGDGIIDNEHSGLDGFITINNTGGATHHNYTDPSIASEYDTFLHYTYKDSTSIYYGAPPWTDSIPTRFMYFGNSDSCNWATNGIPVNDSISWDERSYNNAPYDRRGVGIMKPFDFNPNETQTIEIAMVWARDSIERSVPALMNAIDSVRYFYTNSLHPCGGTILSIHNITDNGILDVSVYPNPTQNILNIQFKDPNFEKCTYHIFDVNGRLVKTGLFKSNHRYQISTSTLDDGIYFVQVIANNRIVTKKFVKI